MQSLSPPNGVLVAGAGSIGGRHLRNLRALGIGRLAVCDPDGARREALARELEIAAFADLESALAELRPAVVFVCSPPVFHVEQALLALRASAHVFVEKPLSHSLDGVGELMAEAEARGRVVQVGYNLRFHPGLNQVKQLLDAGRIGRVLWAHAEFGQYLPDWRPARDYRETYTARRELGGGIILDASHELDYLIWLLGAPARVVCVGGRVSDLEMSVEDCVTLLLQFADGAQADVHLDCVQRAYTRTCKLAGEKGTLIWDYSANEVRLYLAETKRWETLPYAFSPNDMYVAEVRDFLDCAATGRQPRVTLADGRRTLEVALTAKAQIEEIRQEHAAHAR